MKQLALLYLMKPQSTPQTWSCSIMNILTYVLTMPTFNCIPQTFRAQISGQNVRPPLHHPHGHCNQLINNYSLVRGCCVCRVGNKFEQAFLSSIATFPSLLSMTNWFNSTIHFGYTLRSLPIQSINSVSHSEQGATTNLPTGYSKSLYYQGSYNHSIHM